MISRILIIEDEQINADRLRRLIKITRPNATIIGELDSIEASVAWFEENKDLADLVLMDIRLSDGISFDILEKVKVESPIIFTTAYDEYAVRAFKYHSVDYLLKPVEQEELDAAITKLEGYIADKPPVSFEGLINFLKPKDYRTRFLLPYRDGYKTILIGDIAYFYSELKITRAKLYNDKEEILPQTLEELDQELDPKYFFRANRQYIIHIDAIKQIFNYFNGKLKVEIKNDPTAEIIVSRDKAHLLKKWMDF